MGKIVTAHYTNTVPASTTINSGLTYQTSTVAPTGFYSALVAPAGDLVSTKVPLLSEGLLKQLTVVQTSGTSVAFKVELLMSSMPYPTGTYAVGTSPVGTINLFRIIPQQSGTSGNALDITPDTDIGWPFRNVDGDHTNNQRYVYLIILPTAAGGSTTWDAFIMAESNHA